jgi:hypothetical protein
MMKKQAKGHDNAKDDRGLIGLKGIQIRSEGMMMNFEMM